MKIRTKIIIIILGSIGYGAVASILYHDVYWSGILANIFLPIIIALIVTLLYEIIRGIIKKKFFEKNFIGNFYLAWSTFMVLLIISIIGEFFLS